MTWLIVGRNGQLGQSFTSVLKERGIDFQATSSIELDIRSPEKTLTFINSVNPSVIINTAAWTDVDGAEKNFEAAFAINSLGVKNLALAARSIDSVLVHISTDYVFSGIGTKPWAIDDDCAPSTTYGKTKKAGENEILENYPEQSYIFRTAWLYSQWGKNFAKTMTGLALNQSELHKKVRVVNDQVGQPTSAIDLAYQIVDSVSLKIPFGIYHATNSGQATWFEFAQAIFKLANSDYSRVEPILTSDFPTPATRPGYSVLSHEDWANTTVSNMKNWQIALEKAMPSIISAVKEEQ